MGNNVKYEKADAEIIYFTNQDVITTSGACYKGNNKNQGGGGGAECAKTGPHHLK